MAKRRRKPSLLVDALTVVLVVGELLPILLYVSSYREISVPDISARGTIKHVLTLEFFGGKEAVV